MAEMSIWAQAKQLELRNMTSWDYYDVGLFDAAGVRILSIVHLGRNQSTTFYHVRFLCCLHEADISHKKLSYRVKQRARRCVNCAGGSEESNELNIGLSSRDHGVTPPAWPVPRVEE